MPLYNTLGAVNTRDIVEVVIICIPIIVTMYYNNRRIRRQRETDMKEKADLIYVDNQDKALHHRVDESDLKLDKKADKSLVESMDHKLDLILQQLK